MIKVRDIFNDPDMVAQSEYRAIFEVALEAVFQDSAYLVYDENREIEHEDAVFLKTVLEESRDVAAELVEDLTLAIEKERMKN